MGITLPEIRNCSVCDIRFPDLPVPGRAAGYATLENGNRICYSCCGILDRQTMVQDGHSKHLPLYWNQGKVSNWPGTLVFQPFRERTGRHNIAGTRTDIWFLGPDKFIWHGVTYGHYTQVLHCTRTKATRVPWVQTWDRPTCQGNT